MKPELTTLCYIEKDGAYLMLHRTKKENDINQGKWIGVGGHLEVHETPEECVRREAREETGLTLSSLSFRGVVHFSSGEAEEEMFVYTSDRFLGELIECREGELAWIRKEKIMDLNLWEGDRIFLPLLMGDNQFFRFSLCYTEDGHLISDPLSTEASSDPVILQEKGAVRRYGKKFAAFGEKALLVTGKHSAVNCGALSDVTEVLDDCGIAYSLFDQTEENPSTDTIMLARDQGLREGVDFVIGIGGGSPLDAAKGIALMIAHPEEEKDYLYESEPDAASLPVIAIPTTAGTGSEATGVSVLTRKERRTKGSIPAKIYPVFALSDPDYLQSVGKELMANTAIDSLCHLLESYLNTKATDFSRALSMQGLALWRKIKDVVSGRREVGEEDRKDLMCASTMAGLSIAVTGTCLPHALSYTLTMEADIPHGKAAGFFLSRFLRETGEDGMVLLRLAGFFDTEELEGYYRAVCKPGSLEREVLLRAVETVAVSPKKLALAPFVTDRSVLLRIAGEGLS